MKRRSNRKTFFKLIILLFFIVFSLRTLNITLSKYESISNSNANIDIAFYVLNQNSSSMDLKLDSIVPRNEPYVYTFSISNEKSGKRAETDMEYNLKIVSTTNLPLTYELYLNQTYSQTGAKNIITQNQVTEDEYNTFFRDISTDVQYFSHNETKINIYQLVVYFPETYNNTNYKDIIEGIEINVDSRQSI